MTDPRKLIQMCTEHKQSELQAQLPGAAFQWMIDRRVADAEAAGFFNNLPGAGKPLNLDDDSMVPEEDRASYRLLKHSGFSLPWIELQKTIKAEQEKLKVWLNRINCDWPFTVPQEQQRIREEYQQRLSDLNRMIMNYNLMAPPVIGQIPLFQLWRELRKLGNC